MFSAVLIAAALASKVVDLTADSFDSFIKENKVTLVEFYAPWCGHCKALAPEYDAASEQLEGVVKIAKVDCDAEKDLCTKNGVQGFPTLKIFRDEKPTDYKGQRTATSIVEIMKRQVAPAVTSLTADNWKEFKDSDDVVIIMKAKKDSADHKAFVKVANSLRNDFVFGFLEAEETTLTLYKKFDEKKNVFDGKYDVSTITKFVKDKSTPLMPDIGPHNYEKLVNTGKPIAFFFHGDDEQKGKYGPDFEKIAADYKDKINFVYLNAVQFGGFADTLALKQEWPAFGIHDAKTKEKYPFDQSLDFTAENLREFVKDFASGKIKSTVKSEEIPESNNDPVTVVVAKQFDKIVMDKSKDVLVEFYAPWCGHCKKLAPIWEELGASVANENLVIAKCDATANDVPVEIQGYPTVILFKADTNKQVVFDGDRSLSALQKFLKENAVHGKDIVIAEAKEEAPADEEEEHAEL